jgi:hypothetical protein
MLDVKFYTMLKIYITFGVTYFMDVVYLIILKITKNITKHCVSGTKSVPFIRLKTRLIPTQMYPGIENRFVRISRPTV